MILAVPTVSIFREAHDVCTTLSVSISLHNASTCQFLVVFPSYMTTAT